jgi:hypothetical protein
VNEGLGENEEGRGSRTHISWSFPHTEPQDTRSLRFPK